MRLKPIYLDGYLMDFVCLECGEQLKIARLSDRAETEQAFRDRVELAHADTCSAHAKTGS